jgi:hypothetical protein
MLGIATRFYGLTAGDVERLVVWLKAALAVVPAGNVFVAINIDNDLSGGLDFLRKNYPEVVAFPVTPWGKVVQAPNALLLKGAEKQLGQFLFASTEYPVTPSLVKLLQSYCDRETLVVGARLPGHDFKGRVREGVVVKAATGLQIPWNTYALWSMEYLTHTGFVLTADSFTDANNAGMEEMGTIAAQQILWTNRAVAKLVNPRAGDLVTNTRGWNINRQERHRQIVESKNNRSALQLARLSLPAPDVLHIDPPLNS